MPILITSRAALLARVAAPLLLLSGCSRHDAGGAPPQADASSSLAPAAGRVASCDRVAAMSVCSEYAGAYLAQNEALLGAQCARLAGTFVAADCPNTAVVGSCTLSTGEVRKLYGSGGASYDEARAAKECASYGGAWRAFP